MHKFLPVVIALLGLAACENPPAENRSEKIAEVYCTCTTGLAVLNARATEIQGDSTREAEFAQLLVQMDSAFNAARDCAGASIVGQYGKLGAAELQAVETSLAAKCPAMAGHKDVLRELLGE